MKHHLNEGPRSGRLTLTHMCLAALLCLTSILAAACGTDADSGTVLAPPHAKSTTTSGPTEPPATILDGGDMTTSTAVPASVPALASGITPEQVLELVADWSHVAPGDWELRTHETFSDWAVANLYTGKLSEQMDERGVTAVFQKRGGAWFQAGWVSVSDSSQQREIELANMGAPAEVWSHLGLEWKGSAQLYPPEQMPDDFGFVAAYGVMGRNVIDTFQGTFTKDLGLTEERVTTSLSLAPQVLETLYRGLVLMETQWQSFTTAFSPDPDPANTGTTTYTSTYYTYRLEWQATGFRSLPIVWEDCALSTDPRAAALREWFKDLRQMIEATPEWKALPPMTGGYG